MHNRKKLKDVIDVIKVNLPVLSIINYLKSKVADKAAQEALLINYVQDQLIKQIQTMQDRDILSDSITTALNDYATQKYENARAKNLALQAALGSALLNPSESISQDYSQLNQLITSLRSILEIQIKREHGITISPDDIRNVKFQIRQIEDWIETAAGNEKLSLTNQKLFLEQKISTPKYRPLTQQEIQQLKNISREHTINLPSAASFSKENLAEKEQTSPLKLFQAEDVTRPTGNSTLIVPEKKPSFFQQNKYTLISIFLGLTICALFVIFFLPSLPIATLAGKILIGCISGLISTTATTTMGYTLDFQKQKNSHVLKQIQPAEENKEPKFLTHESDLIAAATPSSTKRVSILLTRSTALSAPPKENPIKDLTSDSILVKSKKIRKVRLPLSHNNSARYTPSSRTTPTHAAEPTLTTTKLTA